MLENENYIINKDILISAIVEISNGKLKVDWTNREIIFIDYENLTFDEFLIKFLSIGKSGLNKNKLKGWKNEKV